jgi:hypothetical protein
VCFDKTKCLAVPAAACSDKTIYFILSAVRRFIQRFYLNNYAPGELELWFFFLCSLMGRSLEGGSFNQAGALTAASC